MKKWKIILAVICHNFLVKIGKSVNFTDFIRFYNIFWQFISFLDIYSI